MTKIALVEESWKDAPKTHGIPALAWCTKVLHANENTTGTVHVVRGFKWLFYTARIAHEVEHLIEEIGNEMHDGHTWHFCGRSWHALRFNGWMHVGRRSWVIAEMLCARPSREVDVSV